NKQVYLENIDEKITRNKTRIVTTLKYILLHAPATFLDSSIDAYGSQENISVKTALTAFSKLIDADAFDKIFAGSVKFQGSDFVYSPDTLADDKTVKVTIAFLDFFAKHSQNGPTVAESEF